MAGFSSKSYLSSSCPVWPARDQGLQRISGFWFWASLKRKRFRGFLEVPRCSSSFSVTRQTSLSCLEKLWPFRICLACNSTVEIVRLLSGRKPSLVLVWAAVSDLTVSCNDWVTLRWALQWLLWLRVKWCVSHPADGLILRFLEPMLFFIPTISYFIIFVGFQN